MVVLRSEFVTNAVILLPSRAESYQFGTIPAGRRPPALLPMNGRKTIKAGINEFYRNIASVVERTLSDKLEEITQCHVGY